jgi:hypothetical protein
MRGIRNVFDGTKRSIARNLYRFAGAAAPATFGIDHEIVDDLDKIGGTSLTLDQLGIDGSDALLAEGDRLMDDLEKLPLRTGAKSYFVTADPEHIIRYPAILRWGLDERLLAIASSYLGLPVAYRGVLARLDFPDGQVQETRLWHLDQEDAKIMKIIVYLGDVDLNGGPFEFIPKNCHPPLDLAEGSKLRVTDEAALERAVPPKHWRALTGERGTVAFADTCSVLHRGRLPTKGARRTLFFAYNSQWPQRPTYCEPMFPVERFADMTGALSDRQRAAIRYRYV